MYRTFRITSAASPCFDCNDRYPGCHSKCNKYKVYKKKREEVYAERKANQDVNDFVSDVIVRKQQIIRGAKRK